MGINDHEGTKEGLTMIKGVIEQIIPHKQAVLLLGEDEEEVVIPCSMLPRGAKEGDWVKVERLEGAITRVEMDPEETAKTKARISAKLESLRSGKESKYKR
jgi:hypothetical protein